MASIRTQLVTSFAVVAGVTMVGSIVAIFGLHALERHAIDVSTRSWPTADMCMEYWIGSLEKARATRHLDSGAIDEARLEAAWATDFVNNSLRRLREANSVSAGQLAEMTELAEETDESLERYFSAFEAQLVEAGEIRRLQGELESRLTVLETSEPLVWGRLRGLPALARSMTHPLTAESGRISEAARRNANLAALLVADSPSPRVRRVDQSWRELLGHVERLGVAQHDVRAAAQDLDRQIETIHGLIEPIEDRMDRVMDDAGAAVDQIAGQLRLQLILVGLASLALAVVLSLSLSRRLVAPLRRLSELTRQIAKGQLDNTVGIARSDEVGELAQNFDQMSSRLREFRSRLTASNASHRALFEHAGHAVVVCDQSGRVIEANPAFSDLIGARELKLGGLDLGEFVKLDLDALGGRATLGSERWLTRVDATSVPVEMWASRLPDGRLLYHVRSLAEQRRLQEALVQGEKLSAIGQLAAGIAHELRNPLFVISNVMFELRSTLQGKDPLVLENLDMADEENRRARKIIDNLLEFARPADTDAGYVDVQSQIGKVVRLFAAMLQKDGIELREHYGPCVPCRFHPDGFKQVLVNLISNAIDSMAEGGVLTIRAASRPDGRVQIDVEDTGAGISPEVRDEIFNPFFTTKGPGRGTGLGLAIVHGSVRRFGGEIKVEARQPSGTRFRLILQASHARRAVVS